VRAMSGTELSRVRTEFRLRLLEPINKSPLESSGAGVVMQSSEIRNKICIPAFQETFQSNRQFNPL